MNKSLSVIGLGLVLALSAPALKAVDAGFKPLSGHVPAIVSRLPSKGPLAATNLSLAIGLPLRNTQTLTNLLHEIGDPASGLYHHYLTPAQFADLFGPSEADYRAVADFARQHHLTVTHTHTNRLLLDVSGLSTDIEQAFNIKFKTYAHPTEARDFFAPDSEPSVPAGLQIQDVSGLANYDRPRSHFKGKLLSAVSHPPVGSPSAVRRQNGSGPYGTYMGDDFRNAYIPGSPLKGAGQVNALVQFDGYLLSDIQEYEAMTGRTNILLQNILLDGFNGQPTGNGGEVEVSLDIEMLVSMAPALAKILVYEGNPYSGSPNDVLNQIATDDVAHQISCSWTWGYPTGTTEAILQQMALQGQSFYQASGDSDSYPVGSVVETPSDSPYVTSVGGTTLTMTPGGGAKVSETVWNWDAEGDDGVGSSGGISISYAIPSWQTNVNMSACQGSTTYRNFPDVALTADNVLVIADGGLEYDEGGTSCATPLWGGFTALINEQETEHNRGPIGFINPALYALAGSPSYGVAFNDITTGSNTWSGSPSLFYAVTNYDLCTGLGTPNGTNLINALVSGPVFTFKIASPPSPYGYTLAAVNGGTPNGEWSLFVQNALNSGEPTGSIADGWSINLVLGSPVTAEADLGLTLAPSAPVVSPGSNLVYYLTVTNFGGMSTATNVLVQDTLPTDVVLLSSASSLGLITRNGSLVMWAVGNLITNAGATLALTVQTADTSENILNYAIASSQTPDPNPADSSAFVSVTVGTLSAPQLSANVFGANGAFSLSVSGSPGATRIQASTNLVTWNTIYTTNSVTPFTFTDPNKTNYPYRFYRALTEP